jgi:hypothetical protein
MHQQKYKNLIINLASTCQKAINKIIIYHFVLGYQKKCMTDAVHVSVDVRRVDERRVDVAGRRGWMSGRGSMGGGAKLRLSPEGTGYPSQGTGTNQTLFPRQAS